MDIPDRVLLPLYFDPVELQRDLKNLQSSQWIAHFVTQNYDGEWSVIPLRGSKGASHPVKMIYSDPTCTEFEDTPFIQHTPYIASLLKRFSCAIDSVRLMKLAPGSVIKEHQDHDLDIAQGVARLHIPIITNPNIDFRLNGSQVTMHEGQCWYLRLSDRHSVSNNGQQARVHLVLDVRVNPWFLSLIQQAIEVK